MAVKEKIYTVCGYCGGDGIVTTPSPTPLIPLLIFPAPSAKAKVEICGDG